MQQTDSTHPLRPYLVPVVGTDDQPIMVMVMATPEFMRQLRMREVMDIHMHQAVDLYTATEAAQLSLAVIAKEEHLHTGGELN